MKPSVNASGDRRTMTTHVDGELIDLLVHRDGRATEVVCRDGSILTFVNIAWGYDEGESHAHVTTNISPDVIEASMDLFFTHEVTTVRDPLTGAVLLQTNWP